MRTLICLVAFWAGIGVSQVAAAELPFPEETSNT